MGKQGVPAGLFVGPDEFVAFQSRRDFEGRVPFVRPVGAQHFADTPQADRLFRRSRECNDVLNGNADFRFLFRGK